MHPATGPLAYHQGDERPAWHETILVNGAADDLSTGFTFQVTIADTHGVPVHTKVTDIVGHPDGLVAVAWAAGDLDHPPGVYVAQLVATRTADHTDWTVHRELLIGPRY